MEGPSYSGHYKDNALLYYCYPPLLFVDLNQLYSNGALPHVIFDLFHSLDSFNKTSQRN